MISAQQAFTVIQSLLAGKDPLSGGPLPENILARDDSVAALRLAADAIDQMLLRENKRAANYPNSGKAWTSEEEELLSVEFERGTSTKLLAAEHKRSLFAIHARLLKLGKLKEGQVVDGVVVQRPRYDGAPRSAPDIAHD